MFNYENVLVELAQTNEITVEVEGFTFKAYTLCETHNDILDLCDTQEELLDQVSNLALRVRDDRAIEFKGMTEDKLTKFWANGEYEEFEDPTVRHAFAEDALNQSGMADILNKFAPIHIDGDDLPDVDLELGELQEALNNDRAAAG